MKTFLLLFKIFLQGYVFTYTLLLILIISFNMEGGTVDGGIEMMCVLIAIFAAINGVALLLFFLLPKSVKIFIASWEGVLIEVITWLCCYWLLDEFVKWHDWFYLNFVATTLLTGIVILFYSKRQTKLVPYCLSLLLLTIIIWVMHQS